MGIKVNQKELSKIFGKSVQAIQKWQEDGMPIYKHGGRGKENQYDTAEVVNWLLARQTQKKQTEYDIERTRLARTQADKNELEVNLLRGVSIDSRLIEPAWMSLCLHIRSGFLSLPGKMAPRLAQEDKPDIIQKLLQLEIDDLLRILSKTPPKLEVKGEN